MRALPAVAVAVVVAASGLGWPPTRAPRERRRFTTSGSSPISTRPCGSRCPRRVDAGETRLRLDEAHRAVVLYEGDFPLKMYALAGAPPAGLASVASRGRAARRRRRRRAEPARLEPHGRRSGRAGARRQPGRQRRRRHPRSAGYPDGRAQAGAQPRQVHRRLRSTVLPEGRRSPRRRRLQRHHRSRLSQRRHRSAEPRRRGHSCRAVRLSRRSAAPTPASITGA